MSADRNISRSIKRVVRSAGVGGFIGALHALFDYTEGSRIELLPLATLTGAIAGVVHGLTFRLRTTSNRGYWASWIIVGFAMSTTLFLEPLIETAGRALLHPALLILFVGVGVGGGLGCGIGQRILEGASFKSSV